MKLEILIKSELVKMKFMFSRQEMRHNIKDIRNNKLHEMENKNFLSGDMGRL